MEVDQELAAQLYSLEQSLLDPAVRQSSAVFDLLAEDFVEFGSSGRRLDRTQTIAALQQTSPGTITATDMRATHLANTVVLVTYRACRHGHPAVHSLRSSIWQLRGGKWQIIFHQGTLTGTS
jgi:hypothetical protein